ncbi:glycoside hydrolase family 43 protein [Auricularia subglabra TFB-10046 SS5]|nr:glycoside hydrolase family 43 protein [Auricularia subglabra TFB-10046 SS5]
MTYLTAIKSGTNADPWIIFNNDWYYYVNVADGGLKMRKSQDLTNWNIDGVVVWKAPSQYKNIWAPELHLIRGAWYIYVAMDNGENKNHRMYVFKGRSATDPMQPFDFVGQITSSDNNWAIDGTVMQYTPNGKLYFIWSGWKDSSSGNEQNLYIAEMSSPTTINSTRVLLHEPKPSWQRTGSSGINEGPTALVNGKRWFIVYSAAGSWSDNYCLALMGIDGGKDPLKASNWWRLDDRPVMWSSSVAFGPGHASFTVDRAGTPHVVYHANEKSGTGWSGRSVRTQSFKWNTDGSPWLPTPVGFTTDLPHPK